MSYLLQFCGLSDPLQLFYLEQSEGPAFAGFRPVQLDGLLAWAQAIGRQRHWDLEGIQHAVMAAWMERADVIGQWQLRLRHEPQDRLLVAGLGTPGDWERRCEQLLQA
jgi:hypothetical protein